MRPVGAAASPAKDVLVGDDFLVSIRAGDTAVKIRDDTPAGVERNAGQWVA